LIQHGGLVVLAGLAGRMGDDRAVMLGAFLMVGELLDGAGGNWVGASPAQLIDRWRHLGVQALGGDAAAGSNRKRQTTPLDVLASGVRRRRMNPWQAHTRHLIEVGALVVKAGLVDRVQDDRATLLGAYITIVTLLDGGGDDDLADVSRADLTTRWRRRGLRRFDANAEAKTRTAAATLPREVSVAAVSE
jgi:hypothetical protein